MNIMMRLQERVDELWSKVQIGDKPIVTFNNRLRTSAGRCFYTLGTIELEIRRWISSF